MVRQSLSSCLQPYAMYLCYERYGKSRSIKQQDAICGHDLAWSMLDLLTCKRNISASVCMQ